MSTLMRRKTQTALFITGLLAMIAVHAGLSLDLWTQILILAPAVALLGLPHGALDLPMAEAIWPLRGWRDRAVFFASYLALAGIIGLLWWVAPAVALTAFLAYSALHFSGDWQEDGVLWRVAGGLSAIGAPAVFHRLGVADIFAVLGPVSSAGVIAQGTALAGILGAGMVAYALAASRLDIKRAPLREVGAIWIGAALLPPLLYFVVYFCLLHSLRHLTGTLAVLPDRRRALRSAAAITVVSLCGAALGLVLLTGRAPGDVTGPVLQVIFIGLAALTVPHMLLVERFSMTAQSQSVVRRVRAKCETALGRLPRRPAEKGAKGR